MIVGLIEAIKVNSIERGLVKRDLAEEVISKAQMRKRPD